MLDASKVLWVACNRDSRVVVNMQHRGLALDLLEDDGVMSPYLAYISSYSPPIPSIHACHESPIYILHFIHEQLSLNLTS